MSSKQNFPLKFSLFVLFSLSVNLSGQNETERIQWVKNLFKKYGADTLLKKEIDHYTNKAFKHLSEIELPKDKTYELPAFDILCDVKSMAL